MNTCGDEVLPYPPDVLNGLKAFKIGLYIAFGLASLSHVVINNIRREKNCENSLTGGNASETLSNFYALTVHMIPVIFIISQELNYSYSNMYSNGFSEERVYLWEESVTLMVLALIVLARSGSIRVLTVLAFGFFIVSLFLLRSTDDVRIALVLFGCTIFAFIILCFTLLKVHDNAAQSAAQWLANYRYEQQSGVTVLRGVFLLFAAALVALHVLQRQGVVDAPIATLCTALLAGCVRHVFVVVWCDNHNYISVDDSVAEQSSADAEEEEETEHQIEQSVVNEFHYGGDELHRESSVSAHKPELYVETAEFEDMQTEDLQSHSDDSDTQPSAACRQPASNSPALGLLGDHRSETMSEELHKLPTIDEYLSPEFQRSGSTQMSEHRHHALNHDNASRRQLLRYVFHEMRAPLNSISMAVDLLTHHSKRGTPKNKFQDLEALQIIEEATLTMERTLKDTMTLQKIDEGSLVAQWKIFSLLSLCDDIKDALKQVLRSKSVTLNYAVDPEVPDQIVGDHFRIRHVVAHVLSNAIKFSRAGGVVEMHVGLRGLSPHSGTSPMPMTGHTEGPTEGSLGRSYSSDLGDADREVSVEQGKEYDLCPSARDSFEGIDDSSPTAFLKSPTANVAIGKYVVISITDNGVGMSSELQESDIFKPFNQLKTEECSGFRGTGLGLAICKKIITFLHGSITYSSTAGVGTTFRISFPLTLLDAASMDEVEEEDLPAIELACGSFDPADYLTSPKTQQRNRAIAKAKSFRGEKLLSILHNQSNVFDCPTPGSCSAPFLFHSRFSSIDEQRSSGSSGAGSVNVSASASKDHTPRSASSPAKGIVVSRVPSIAEEVGNESGTTFAGYRGGGASTPPRRAFFSGASTPPRPLGAAASTLRNLPVVHEGRPTSSEHQSEERGSCSKVAPVGLTVNTTRDVSSFFLTTLPNTTGTSLLNDDTTFDADQSVSSNAQHTPNTTQTSHTLHSSLSHSQDPCATSPIGNVSNSQEYVALTEKNVNLHILRTAAADGIRVLKPTTSTSRKASSKEVLLATLKASTILVVDDAASNRKLLSMMLKRAGFGTVDLVEDGQAAVDYCDKARMEGVLPKIIFMDNTMPRMTGIEASRIIRQGGYPHLIIGVTGNSMEEELDEFIASGADLVIVKPLKNQSLEMLLGFIQVNGFDSSHGFRIDTVGQEFTWVPRSSGES